MATLDTAHNYSPTWLGLATQLGIAGSISLYCLLQFEWNRRKKSMAYLYTPRTRLSKNSSPPIPPGLFSWVKATIFLPEHFYLQNVGLDAVMYLRFLKIAFRFLLFNLLIVGSILMPINYFGKGSETGVQVFSVNNLAENNDSFLWAHMFCTYVVSISWMYLLYINYRDYVEMRKEYFVNKAKVGSVSARSVIVSRIPEDLRSEEKLKAYFETLGVGRVESVRLVRHTGKLDRKINRRENALLALERAHIQLAKNVCHGLMKRHWFFGNGLLGRWFNGQANVSSTALEDGSTRENQRLQSLIEWMERRRKKGGDEEESFTSPVNKNSAIHTTSTFSTGEEFLDQEDGYGRQFLIWEALAQIPKITIDRFQPTHRKGYFGTGTRVRSIDHYLKKFNYLDRRIAELRALPVNDKPYKPTSTGFVTFYSHSSAHLAAQSIMCSKPHTCTTRMAPEPRDLLWENLAMAFREKVIRYLLVNVSVWALTIFWLFPIFAFLTLTSFDSLSQRIRFLSVFLESAPIVRTLLQNVLPTVLVTFFMSLLPWILMEISKQESFSAYSELEESVLKRYYYFSFFNVFIVFLLGITFLESIFDVLNQPTSIIETLAQSLPQGATFFINYIVFNICSHGLELIQVGSQLFLHIILTSRFVTTTPRMLERVTSPWAFQFYYYYPNHILVLVITITYSTINPLILIFALIYYAMALVVFKHQFAYAYVRRYESGGKFYRNVFRYTTDGLIIFQLTMIGLLWLRRTLVPGALLVPLIFGTGYFKYYCHKTFYSRTHYLAMDTRIEVNPSSSVGQTPNSSTQRESHQLDGEGLNEKGSTVAVSPATSQTEHPDKTEKSQNGKENIECKPSSSVEIGFGSVFNRRSVGEGFQRLKVDENADNISDTIATNEQSIGADNANASEPDPSPEARRVGPRVRLSLEQGTVRPGRSSTELQRLSAPPTPKTPNVETVDENTSNLDTKVGLTLDMEFLKRNNKSAVSTLVTGEFSKASDSVNSEATPGTGSASSNGTTPVTTPNPNCKDSRDTRPPQITIEAKELTIASPISGAGVSLSPNVTNNNRLSIPSPPSRQASGFLSRHNIHLAHDPNGKLLQDDTSPYQTYFHPNLVKALNRKLWLPRNPLKKISVEDTVELERALTSSEGGYGLVGYWGGASGFLGEARISMYDTNQGLVFPVHERGVSGLSGISVVSELFGHGDENSRIYLQRRGTTENTNGTNTPGEPVVNDNGQLFSPLSPLSLEGEEGLVHVDDFVSGELESGELTSGESS